MRLLQNFRSSNLRGTSLPTVAGVFVSSKRLVPGDAFIFFRICCKCMHDSDTKFRFLNIQIFSTENSVEATEYLGQEWLLLIVKCLPQYPLLKSSKIRPDLQPPKIMGATRAAVDAGYVRNDLQILHISKVADTGIPGMLDRLGVTGLSSRTSTNPFVDPRMKEAMNLNFCIQSDVYSFGVFLLELVSGRKAVSDQNIIQWV